MYEQMMSISVFEYDRLIEQAHLLDKLIKLVRDSVNDEEAAQELMRLVEPPKQQPLLSKNDSIYPGEL